MPADILPLVVEIPAWQACRSRFFLLILSDAEHCVLVLDMLPKVPHESFWVHLFPSASPSAKQMVYFLERGERGLTKLDVTLGLEGSLGQPAGLPTSLRTRLPRVQHPSCLCRKETRVLRDVRWERTTRGWCVHLCPLLAGSTPSGHCTTVLPEPVTDPAAAERWESQRSQACPRRATALAPTKAPLRAALTRCAPQLSSPSLALGHPSLSPSRAPSGEGIH